ncbi:MAG: choice-of-anchor L domain-containing protein [Myxococcota bacterium]
MLTIRICSAPVLAILVALLGCSDTGSSPPSRPGPGPVGGDASVDRNIPPRPDATVADGDAGSSTSIRSEVCDQSLPMTGSAEDAARAMGLCRFVDEASGEWGVLSARFTTADGSGSLDSSEQVGVLPSFGSVNARQGSALFAMSSGTARAPGMPGHTSDCDFFGSPFDLSPTDYPAGFPTPSSSCPGIRSGPPFNAAALELRIRAPEGARSFSFASAFFTYEYPEFICSEFNDFFVVLRENNGAMENIAFDADGNPVSVNNSFLRACAPGTHGGKTFDCPLGREFLRGTGYDGTDVCGSDDFGFGFPGETAGASTGWLKTTAPVTGGEILTLRFAIWDSSDPDLDSLVLVDDFRWELEEAPVETRPLL